MDRCFQSLLIVRSERPIHFWSVRISIPLHRWRVATPATIKRKARPSPECRASPIVPNLLSVLEDHSAVNGSDVVGTAVLHSGDTESGWRLACLTCRVSSDSFQRMATDEPRCPYCVEGNGFKLLTQVAERLLCERCAHVSRPADLDFLCPCSRCAQTRVHPSLPRGRR